MDVGTLLVGRRVLAVDGSEGIGSFLLELLEARGAHVTTRQSAAGAREAFAAGGNCELVILDILLPDADGVELLRELRRVDDNAVIVVLTGAGGGQSATIAMRAGADAYVEKQHLTGVGENEHLFDALAHAFEHRSGAIARRQVEAMRTDFYNMVTHDLRNPAGNVLVALKLLQSGKAGPLTTQQVDLVALAFRSASKFVGLINDYLDFAKIDAGYLRLDREEADLVAVVRASAASARSQAEVKSLTLSVDAPERLMGLIDAAKLEQVVDNLISNAVKYTPDGGRVGIRLTELDTMARLEVTDSGEGIASDQLEHLFTKFHRVPGQKTAQIKGTGLGLLIIREIVQAHGGQVRVESAGVPGEGSTFTVELPLREPVR